MSAYPNINSYLLVVFLQIKVLKDIEIDVTNGLLVNKSIYCSIKISENVILRLDW